MIGAVNPKVIIIGLLFKEQKEKGGCVTQPPFFEQLRNVLS